MRNKDYLLVYENGNAIAIEGDGNAIANRMYTALTIRKGTLISDYGYGSELHTVKKDVPSAALLAQRFCEAALSKIAELEQVNVDVEVKNLLLNIEIKAKANGRYINAKINV